MNVTDLSFFPSSDAENPAFKSLAGHAFRRKGWKTLSQAVNSCGGFVKMSVFHDIRQGKVPGVMSLLRFCAVTDTNWEEALTVAYRSAAVETWKEWATYRSQHREAIEGYLGEMTKARLSMPDLSGIPLSQDGELRSKIDEYVSPEFKERMIAELDAEILRQVSAQESVLTQK